MRQFLKTSFVYLRLKLAEVLEYRVVTIFWSFVSAIPLLVAAGIWLGSPALHSSFGGYSRDEIVAYYLLFFFLSQMFSSYIQFSTMDEIINGNLSLYLLKPFPYFAAKTVNEIGWRTIDTLLRVPVFVAITFFASGFLAPGEGSFIGIIFAIATVLGVAIYHLIAFTIGILAFWFTRIESFHSFYFFVIVLLSGEMIPLHLYPEPLSSLVRVLPFRFIFSFPIEVYLGKLTSNQIVSGLFLSSAWCLVIAGVWWWLWRRGLLRYSAYGG